MPKTALTFKNVGYSYFQQSGYVEALKNISFSIKRGQFISIVGPSGCGKSTLLSIIAGLIQPTSGVIERDSDAERIGFMQQQDYLFPWKTIEENVALGLTLHKKPTKQAVNNLLETLKLSHTAKRFPSELSGGMRQRIALARTLAVQPSILLFDEPFSALDFATKLKLEQWVKEMAKKFDQTCVFVTHDIEEAICMSDTVFLLSKAPGTITKQFTVPAILQELTPLEARRSSQFTPLFQEIWKELHDESIDTKT